MTPAQLQDLNTELTTDPLTRGYAAMGDEAAADRINVADRQPNRETLESGLLVASIVRAEYTPLAAAEKDYLRLVAMAQQLPLTDTVKAELGAIFPAGSTTRANLVALLKRPGTRGEELGLGHVTASDVAKARALP